MTKGDDTKTAILDMAFDMTSELGFEGVTIGVLAKATKMSKSGLFAHFQSKENMQLEILKYAGGIFSESIVIPAFRTEAGIRRIKALVENWNLWTVKLSGGCIFVSASTEFGNREGAVRDYLLRQQKARLGCISKVAQSAIKTGEFRNDIDCEQFAFELYSLLLGFHYYHRLLHDEDIESRQKHALDQLLNNYSQPVS
jgi:AcrR family transcriptional regulator